MLDPQRAFAVVFYLFIDRDSASSDLPNPKSPVPQTELKPAVFKRHSRERKGRDKQAE
jgi:hypothetical protein